MRRAPSLHPPRCHTNYWASQSEKCCPSSSWLAEGSKEVNLCVLSLVFWPSQMQEYTKSQWLLGSLNGPNRQILLSQRNSSKTTRKNWLYVFFEQALITWVHWSCCVTLKALVLIFRTLMLLGGAHGRGPKPTTVFMKPWNCKQVKSTESKLCPQSHRVMVFSPQGLWRGRCIIAFQKGKNLGSIPFSACNIYFLCGLNGVEGDRAKKKSSTKFP